MAYYYVKPASIGGDDGNNGTTFALAKATLNAVYALTSTGDTVCVCSDVSNPFVNITLTLSGAHNVNFIGADTIDGTTYSGTNRAIISSTSGLNLITAINEAGYSCRFYNISLQGTSNTNGYSCASQANMIGHTFINCEFKNLQYGIYLYKTAVHSAEVSIFDCIFYGCTAGIYVYDTNTGYYNVSSCNVINSIFVNCGHGIYKYSGASGVMWCIPNVLNTTSCRFLRNTVGIRCIGVANLSLNMNVFYLNASHAISLDSIYLKLNARNTIFHSNGGYGISSDVASSVGGFHGFVDYNCYYNNTLGAVNDNINGGIIPGNYNNSANPKFASTTLGSEDFRLQEDSPCLGVGTGYVSGQ